MSASQKKTELTKPRLPLFQGILPLDRSRVLADIMAGITLAAVGIPEVMGYTKIIGTPVITGLYTMLLPILAFAIFGSSRHLVVGADSATAVIVAAALVSLAVPSSTRYVALTGLVALVAGGMLLLARLLRLGFLADFLSRTVLVGFLTGVGVQVAFGELHRMLGLEKGGHGFFGSLLFTFQHLPETHLPSVIISLCVLGVIVACDRIAAQLPGALLAVVGMIVASIAFHLEKSGVKVVGEVSSGLPRLGLPDVSWGDLPLVLSVSVSCFIVILAQSAATSRAYALRYRERFDENLDLVGLALANAVAACSGTFVVNGSPTKTAMLDTAGGRSQLSHLATAAMVLLVLLFLTGPLSHLPNAVLAAIVFLIGVKLIDYRGLAEIRRKSNAEFRLAVVTGATVVLVGVEEGILLAVVLSLLDHLRHSYRPHTAVLLQDPDDHWRMVSAEPGKLAEPGLVVYWFGADLYYANANYFAEQVQTLVTKVQVPVHWLVLDAGAITAIDCSAGSTLRELQQELAATGVSLALAHVNAELWAELDRQELSEVIGANRLFDTLRDCLGAYHATNIGQDSKTIARAD
jgi:sulfate permease, SulP family